MKIYSKYSRKIQGYNHIFEPTVALYRAAVDFFIDVCLREWESIRVQETRKQQNNQVERLTIRTNGRPEVPYDFGRDFYKFPSYLRRAAIREAIGKVSSYRSNLERCRRERLPLPSRPQAGYVYPVMYRGNCYKQTGTYTAQIKVFLRNTWDWLTIRLRKSDVDYALRHCAERRECTPVLMRRGKEWFLDFAYEEDVLLADKPVKEQTVLAVDLGINSACTLTAMRSDGTVVGRKFLRLPAEYDCLDHAIGRIKKAQQHGNRRTPRLWAIARGINNRIAVLTAQFIMNAAAEFGADVIVFEHLDVRGKKRGSKKQKLHLWRAAYVQAMVMNKAHRSRLRVSRVNAWGTSRLAFDGSGRVLRGNEADLPSYSLCLFPNGKQYNCDLNAAYNIGARYFLREIEKSLPETARLAAAAKVPRLTRRSTCTLSDLISLNAVLAHVCA